MKHRLRDEEGVTGHGYAAAQRQFNAAVRKYGLNNREEVRLLAGILAGKAANADQHGVSDVLETFLSDFRIMLNILEPGSRN